MTKRALLRNADPICNDEPDVVYGFPKRCRKTVETDVGDWGISGEQLKAGPRGYFAVAKIAKVILDPAVPDRYLALTAPVETDRRNRKSEQPRGSAFLPCAEVRPVATLRRRLKFYRYCVPFAQRRQKKVNF